MSLPTRLLHAYSCELPHDVATCAQQLVGSMLLDYRLCIAAGQPMGSAQTHPKEYNPEKIASLSCMSWNAQLKNLVSIIASLSCMS